MKGIEIRKGEEIAVVLLRIFSADNGRRCGVKENGQLAVENPKGVKVRCRVTCKKKNYL